MIKRTAPFFGESRFRLAALNVIVEGRPLSLRYVSVTRCLTNHGSPSSLSSSAIPEPPTEIQPLWKKTVPFLLNMIAPQWKVETGWNTRGRKYNPSSWSIMGSRIWSRSVPKTRGTRKQQRTFKVLASLTRWLYNDGVTLQAYTQRELETFSDANCLSGLPS